MDMIELAERCERGSGPDRELDWVIAHAVRGEPAHNPGFPLQWLDEDELPAFASSLDASVALLERVLPGWHGNVEVGAVLRDSKTYSAVLVDPTEDPERFTQAEATSPARALLAAILRALAAKDETP